MKANRLDTIIKKILLGVVATIMIISFSACAKKVAFLTSSVVPAARGNVKVTNDKNKNYVIQIDLLNLAEPSRLQPSKQTYVVWMVTNDQLIKNIGQINTSTSMLSKTLKASFETVSPVKPTKIFITAEDDATTQNPGMQVVLSTTSF